MGIFRAHLAAIGCKGLMQYLNYTLDQSGSLGTNYYVIVCFPLGLS